MKEEPSRAFQASRPQSPGPGESRPVDHLQRAREACEHNAWHDAYEAYRLADAAAPLTESDLDGLALASYLLGRDDEFVALKERSHRAHVAVNRAECAARDAFWLAVMFLFRGDLAQSNAWIARGERLLCDRDCAECGYLAMQKVEVLLRGGSPSEAHAMAAGIVALGQRCGDADLVAAACHLQGRAAIAMGESARGLKLLDETMLAAVSGELSPIMTGLMYCSVIDACREAYEWSRAREWTAALSKWCDRQGGMVAFTDACLVHRAEILRLQGAWQDSLTESRRVCDRGDHARRRRDGHCVELGAGLDLGREEDRHELRDRSGVDDHARLGEPALERPLHRACRREAVVGVLGHQPADHRRSASILMKSDAALKIANVVVNLEKGLIAPTEIICRAR